MALTRKYTYRVQERRGKHVLYSSIINSTKLLFFFFFFFLKKGRCGFLRNVWFTSKILSFPPPSLSLSSPFPRRTRDTPDRRRGVESFEWKNRGIRGDYRAVIRERRWKTIFYSISPRRKMDEDRMGKGWRFHDTNFFGKSVGGAHGPAKGPGVSSPRKRYVLWFYNANG